MDKNIITNGYIDIFPNRIMYFANVPHQFIGRIKKGC